MLDINCAKFSFYSTKYINVYREIDMYVECLEICLLYNRSQWSFCSCMYIYTFAKVWNESYIFWYKNWINREKTKNSHTKLQCCVVHSTHLFYPAFQNIKFKNEIFNLIFMLMGLVCTQSESLSITLNCCGWHVQCVHYTI